ncbi:MAG: hypothetical protein QM642_05380 [Edaphocola sp.]
MVKRGVLHHIRKGTFKVDEDESYVPKIPSTTRNIFHRLKVEFPLINLCVWNTAVLGEFMQRQPDRPFVLVETDQKTVEAVFRFLRRIKRFVFIESPNEVLEQYVVGKNEVFIVKPLVAEAPMQNVYGVETAGIEKMLVDVFCDDVIFPTQQGEEMRNIFKEALAKYPVNQNQMLHYADRRGKKEELTRFVKTVSASNGNHEP